MIKAKTGQRGCGTRRSGVYLEVGMGPGGRPFDEFLCDPPVPLPAWMTPEMLANKATLVQRGGTGIVDVISWVGANHYPYLPDFLEEARRMGISRRVLPSFEFEKITPFESQIILVHPRAYNPDWQQHMPIDLCLLNRPGHSTLTTDEGNPRQGPCLYQLYNLIPADDGRPIGQMSSFDPAQPDSFMYQRAIGDTTYQYIPTGESADLQPAIFGRFYLTGVALVKDAAGKVNSAAEEKLSRSRMPYYEADE